MATSDETGTRDDTRDDARDAELAALRARVAELEDELQRQAQASAALVARSQEKLYWLERWNVDLDRVMARRGAVQALESLKVLRGGVRWLRVTSRRLRGGR